LNKWKIKEKLSSIIYPLQLFLAFQTPLKKQSGSPNAENGTTSFIITACDFALPLHFSSVLANGGVKCACRNFSS